MTRSGYHHGDLRNALVEAAVAAARRGGEAAVGLNRLAAELGVSPSAAYRHFPDGLEGLLAAVGEVGRRELADRIRLRTGEARGSRDPRVAAQRRFRASGEAYVEYGVEEPGLFQVACRRAAPRQPAPDADPYALLERCIDDLVSTGALPADRRPDAPLAAWAAVHGLALLLTEGPLQALPPGRRRQVVARTLDVVGAGL